MTNLHQSITVDYLYELFSLRSTNYLRNNCHIDMDHLRNIDQPFKSAKVTASAHGCEELLKLDSMDFHEKNRFSSIFIFISALLRSKLIQVNVSHINKTLNHLYSRYNSIFAEHKNIPSDDLWAHIIYLLNSARAMLGNIFVSGVNKYFGKTDNFPGNFTTSI